MDDSSINNTKQIADFGMARDLEDETYYTPKSKVGKIPIKWTAPEVGTEQKPHSHAIAIILSEILYTFCHMVSGFTLQEVLN